MLTENTEINRKLTQLNERLTGEVRFDDVHQHLYATDASIYCERPVGVAFPKNNDDVKQLIRFATDTGIPLIPRTAGTSLAGQVVGSGLVVDLGRFMTAILDTSFPDREVRVEPGVIQDELNRFLDEHSLVFGPDTSTGNRAMIGGMIGNNSCGSHSILYGTTREHLKAAKVLLSDGTAVELTDWDASQVDQIAGQKDRLGEIVSGLRTLVKENTDEIRSGFPDARIKRRNTGYALDYLLSTVLADPNGAELNLAKFLCGSEGTLALVTEALLNVDPKPTHIGVCVPHFDTLQSALKATKIAVGLEPSAVELIDKKILDLTLNQREHRHNRFFIEGDPAAILVVEFFRDSSEAVEKAKRELNNRLVKEGLCYATADIEANQIKKVWALRKAGLGLLMGMINDEKPVAFVEDTAVAVDDLPAYIDRFQSIMNQNDTDCVFYGHASVGELHLRPLVDLKTHQGVNKLDKVAREVADLVGEFRGSLSGEHGDGRVRSPYIKHAMGSGLVAVFKQVKDLWDPAGIFNPHKIVDPVEATKKLRSSVDQPVPSLPTVFTYEADGSLLAHIERCNGAGACRKLPDAGGGMCPSYMVTKEELHTTRGRANLFRQLLAERGPQETMAATELVEAFDLCLACKSCKRECPASVDMTKLKAEFFQHYWESHRVPIKVLSVGYIAKFNKLALLMPRVANWFLLNRFFGPLFRKILGFAPNIPFPLFSPLSFKRWFKRRKTSHLTGEPIKTVALFADEFTDANDLDVGQAAVELLERLGYRVVIPKHVDSGRPLLSKGLVRAAAKRIQRNVDYLKPIAEQGIPILGLEPSATATLVDEALDLVPKHQLKDAQIVAEAVSMLDDFLASEAQQRNLAASFDAQKRKILFHGHCHQKAVLSTEGSLDALRIPLGHEVEMIDAGCCGMAGAFGYEAKHQLFSQQVFELKLAAAVRCADDTTRISASGFSCRHQITNLTGRRAQHPAQILRDALKPA